jgi:hydrogenase nickel incorporation protein HypA/HybF
MIAQWRLGVMDRMRLIDRPEEVLSLYTFISMRELHAIQSILAKVLLQARESNQRVRSLSLVLGEIVELDQASIQKHWEELSKDTPAERAQLYFRFIKAEVQCMACFQKYQPVNGKIRCPYCGSYGAKVLSGEEFFLESIELDDE